ncbi:FxsA family protein [Virgibacillus halophilus]|uniref:FxsA family protein n=1 Tax=Tigheibacillus halophilus TaxID=361280 RepID=A0ABU5CCG7_9BACI|nr:FxsA family protein [Virgibacillus halophilus]
MRKFIPWIFIMLILEAVVFVFTVKWLGPVAVIFLTAVTALLGIVLAKQQGMKIWADLQRNLRHHMKPGKQILDGVCVLVGAALLIFPGFITDILGLLFVMPWTRVFFRHMLYTFLSALFSKNIIIYRRR